MAKGTVQTGTTGRPGLFGFVPAGECPRCCVDRDVAVAALMREWTPGTLHPLVHILRICQEKCGTVGGWAEGGHRRLA